MTDAKLVRGRTGQERPARGEMLAADPDVAPGKGRGVRPLDKLGVSKHQSSRAQQLARIPADVFERHADRPQNRVLRAGRDAETEARRADPAGNRG